MKRCLTILTLLNIFFSPYHLSAQTKPDIDKIDNAVVIVMSYDYKGNYLGHGSGFIIDNKGTVVTNYHNLKDASSLKVRLDNNGNKEDYDVDNIISGSQSKDLVKISLKNPYAKIFPFLALAKTFPAKGEDCWAIGTPADPKYMNTVSKGLISNIDQYSDPKILQTNAAISKGSSGGALINAKGEVVGVTSARDPTKEGARASINFAIWIGELNNLPPINKKSVIDPASIPCQLGFYTNNPYTGYTGEVYLYIGGLYIGSFSKYFQNNYTPTCGEEGTITRNLYSGTHTYQVYYTNTGQWNYGTITLNPGQCQMFRVGGVTPNYPKVSSSDGSWPPKEPRDLGIGNHRSSLWSSYELINGKLVVAEDYRFFIGGGKSTSQSSSFDINYYFNHSKSGIQFLIAGNSFVEYRPSIISHNFISTYGIDYKNIFRARRRWLHPYIGPSVRYIQSKNTVDSTYTHFSQSQGAFDTTTYSSTVKNQYFYNFRLGLECVYFTRIAISVDFGIGYLTNSGFRAEAEFVLGYRFWRKKQGNY